MGQEFEVKYRTDADTLAKIQAALPGDYKQTNMTTIYYDTPTGELTKRKWMLRHRCENERHVCTLKTPGTETAARGEYEWEGSDIQEALPDLIRQSGLEELKILAEDGLQVVCGAKFVRLYRTITAGVTVAELALDSGILLNGSHELPFAEVELELKHGHPGEVKAMGHILAATFGMALEEKSKFVRARELGGAVHGI